MRWLRFLGTWEFHNREIQWIAKVPKPRGGPVHLQGEGFRAQQHLSDFAIHVLLPSNHLICTVGTSDGLPFDSFKGNSSIIWTQKRNQPSEGVLSEKEHPKKNSHLIPGAVTRWHIQQEAYSFC